MKKQDRRAKILETYTQGHLWEVLTDGHRYNPRVTLQEVSGEIERLGWQWMRSYEEDRVYYCVRNPVKKWSCNYINRGGFKGLLIAAVLVKEYGQ